MHTRLLSGIVLLCTLFAAAAHGSDGQSIYENIKSGSNLTILLSAITEAGQAGTLKAKGAGTVFAPTDEAWKKLGDEELKNLIANKERLQQIVRAHIVPGEELTSDKLKGLSGKEVNKFVISTNDGLKIGSAKVIKPDLKCNNGVLHLIDTVLIPR